MCGGMDGHHQNSVNSSDGPKNPSNETARAEFPTKYGKSDFTFETNGATPPQFRVDAPNALQAVKTRAKRKKLTREGDYHSKIHLDDQDLSNQITPLIQKVVESKLTKIEDSMTEKLKGLIEINQTILKEIQTITKGINELKTARENQIEGVTNAPTALTYAQAVSNSTTGQYKVPTTHELTITLHQVDPKTPVLAEDHCNSIHIKKVMDDSISQTIGDKLDIDKHFITSAKRLPTHTIKLQAQNMQVAKSLKENNDWVPSGLRLHAITYEVAVLRVPVLKEQEPSDIAKELMEQNNFIIPDQIVYAKWAKRQAKKQKYATLKIQLKDVEAAKLAVSMGLSLNAELLLVEPANRIPRQCTKCGKVKHTRRVCRSEAFCFICGSNHEYKECPNKCKVDIRQESGLRTWPNAPAITCAGTEKCTHYTNKMCSSCPEATRNDHTAFDIECPTRKAYLAQIAEQSRQYRAFLGDVRIDNGHDHSGSDYGNILQSSQ